LAAGRRLLLRNAVLVEAPPEPPDAAAEEAAANKAAEEKYKQEKAAFFESLTKERSRFIEGRAEQSKTYDQTILTFSAGAIGLSITFVEKIAPNPFAPWLLYGSWTCFGLAVLSVVVSFVVSQMAFDNEITYVDASWAAVVGQTDPPEKRANRYTEHTDKLNLVSGGMFVCGIVFFVLFGVCNWPAKKEASTLRGTPIKIEITGEMMPDKMNVITRPGAVIEVKKGNTPTPAMLPQAPKPVVPTPAPAPTTKK
jgi:hypothetical protein